MTQTVLVRDVCVSTSARSRFSRETVDESASYMSIYTYVLRFMPCLFI